MDEIKQTKSFVYWVVGLMLLLSFMGWAASRAVSTVDRGIIRYEEYQEIYNTTIKLNEDLCNMQKLPEDDVMFEQFSKAQRENTIRTQINRWVEDYNAKSKMINRGIWKSSTLPYSLTTSQFSCY